MAGGRGDSVRGGFRVPKALPPFAPGAARAARIDDEAEQVDVIS